MIDDPDEMPGFLDRAADPLADVVGDALNTGPVPEPEPEPVAIGGNSGVAGELLRDVIERIERMEEKKKDIADLIRILYYEAKTEGLDVKTIRKVVSLRKQDAGKRAEEQELLDLYLFSIGMA